MQAFRDLKVWKRSYELSLQVYETTRSMPSEERFGLTSQLRRAAVSVIANVAEGAHRQGSLDYARFLNLAQGSVSELECLLLLCRDLSYLSSTRVAQLIEETDGVGRMLSRLRASVLRAQKPSEDCSDDS